MVVLYSEICFHQCVFPEAGFEPQDLVVYSPGPLFALLLFSCTQDAPQAPWSGWDTSSHLNPMSSVNLFLLELELKPQLDVYPKHDMLTPQLKKKSPFPCYPSSCTSVGLAIWFVVQLLPALSPHPRQKERKKNVLGLILCSNACSGWREGQCKHGFVEGGTAGFSPCRMLALLF